jgi:hypothetical protein
MTATTHENGSRSELHDNEDTFGQFKSWGSTPRFHKSLHITEKIDGTNAGVSVQGIPFGHLSTINIPEDACPVINEQTSQAFLVRAQSRKRIITPGNDNFGFASWVWENADGLANLLGYGYHYGEWYGEGIQKNPLAVAGRRWALFNTWHWGSKPNLDRLKMVDIPGLTLVPVLHDEHRDGPADYMTIPNIMEDLALHGSKADGAEMVRQGYDWEPDVYKQPEGIIVWQRETRQRYKILLREDDKHKWEVAQNARMSAVS